MSKALLAVAVLPAVLLVCFASASRAQDVPPGQQPQPPAQGVIAQGHAEIKAQPDIADISITRLDQSRDQEEAVRANAQAAASIRAALKQAGIADADLQTAVYGVEPQYDYTASPPVLTGYQVTDTLRVTVRDLSKTGLLIDEAIKAGGTRIDDVTFDLADHAKTEQSALADAVAQACAKAHVMASAAGITLGRLICLSETGAPQVGPLPMFGPRVMAASPMSQQPTQISPQQIVVTADVTVTYAVANP